MQALSHMGYAGPVVVEPFSQWVRALPPDQSVAATAESLHKIWRIAGI
jgi:predicted xylose isomerase-like sugar epimerase